MYRTLYLVILYETYGRVLDLKALTVIFIISYSKKDLIPAFFVQISLLLKKQVFRLTENK